MFLAGFNCNFENDYCGWSQGPNATINWERIKGSTSTGGTGPSVDHTTSTKNGSYIYVETSYPARPGDKARLLSPKIDGANDQCIEFWYHMYGSDVDTLTVYYYTRTQEGDLILSEPIWTRRNNHGDRWLLGQINFVGGNLKYENVIFEGLVGSSFQGDIALDDISVKYGNCQSPDYHGITCDFEEEHICGYETDPKATMNWLRHKGPTSSIYTGPSTDVTTGTSQGYYMYIETSPPAIKGDTAKLISVLTQPDECRCLHFWYHGYGSDIGELNIYSELDNGIRTRVWSMSRNQGNNWFLARVPTSYTQSYRIIFEGVVGNGYAGDIALDDIYASPHECPQPVDCSFEDDVYEFCTWLNVNDDKFDWNLFSSLIAQPSSIPNIDNTFKNSTGHYTYIDSTSRQPGDNAIILSQLLAPTSDSGQCLTFYFSYLGSPTYSLRVLTREYNNTAQLKWKIDGSQPYLGWNFAQVGLYTDDYYKILIEGILDTGLNGYAAIDDISLRNGFCSITVPSNAGQGLTTITTTKSTTTIPSIIELDCDFNSECSWSNARGNDFNWTVTNAQDGALNFGGPSQDHSTSSSNGLYLIADYTAIIKNNSLGKYESPPMNGSKCVEFWYFMYGPEVGSLSLTRRVNTSTITTKLWTRTGSSDPFWKFAQATLTYPLPSTIFVATFEAQAGTYHVGAKAIDDIIVHDGACNYGNVCTFEDNTFCGYSNDVTANLNWQRAAANTLSNATFPSSDVTLGTDLGSYMYADVQNKPINYNARLISSIQTKTSGSCIHFYFYIYGNNIGSLNVYSKKSGQLGLPAWSVSGNQGNK